ncbi:MAG: helix-turn-helix domain-containing protein [Chloroflexi bacterium]|nr:helix-turn-helix domain-containing protein [Chloroflexota bacterium]
MEDFRQLLSRYRQRAGLSQNALARRVGVNPAYINRLEKGSRGAGKRWLVEAVVEALGLGRGEGDMLLAAAGHLPTALLRLGPLDPTLQLVADVLSDEGIPESQKELFRLHIRLAAMPWRGITIEG